MPHLQRDRTVTSALLFLSRMRPCCPVTHKSARCQALRPLCSLCQLIRPGSSSRKPATCRFAGYRRDTPGRNDWQGLPPALARANFDGTSRRDSLSLKKARPGQRLSCDNILSFLSMTLARPASSATQLSLIRRRLCSGRAPMQAGANRRSWLGLSPSNLH